jgi:hypothetical protein
MQHTVNIKNIIAGLILAALLGANGLLWFEYSVLKRELRTTQAELALKQFNNNVLDFYRLFIVKVLKTEGEVDFETRLQLETTVRELGDEEILAQWNKFTNSQTEEEAQREVKNLLELLVEKSANSSS